MKNQSIRILSYNCQQGAQGENLIHFLLEKSICDAYCFQRFPEKWLPNFHRPHIYQPSFPGAKNGCLTFVSQANPSIPGFLLERPFLDSSQASCFISTEMSGYSLINTLPPYPSDEVSMAEYETHWELLHKRFKGNTIIVGDFHFDSLARKDFFMPFTNLAQEKNFYGKNGESLNLTKCMVNFPARIQSETVIPLTISNGLHLPVIFEVRF